MGFVAVLDIHGLTADEYNAVLAHMGVERRPAPGSYLHVAAPMEEGLRVIELWDSKEGFERFIKEQMLPACAALGIQRETTVSLTPLHNLFAPRLDEIPRIERTKS